MIATWMLYAALLSALVGVAGLALEHAAVVTRRPTRFIWLASMVLSVAWPVGNAALRLMPEPVESVRVVPFTIALQPTVAMASTSIGVDRAAWIDRGLVVLWILFSSALLLRLGHALLTLQRSRNGWRAARVDGMAVRLSPNVGPAVVGLRSMDVVLPEWIMTLDAPLRAIVLRHEQEHRNARDPYLLFAAAVAVSLMPWNVALWLQARRMRLAVEVDCDARVLRAHPSTERYGLLMLTIAQRRSTAPPMFAPMLSEPTSQLERRIVAMRSTSRRFARVTATVGIIVAAGVLSFAFALQAQSPMAPRALIPKGVTLTEEQPYFEFQVTKPASIPAGSALVRYPAELRSANLEGEVLAQFVTDTSGLVEMGSFKVLKSDHDLFTSAVRKALSRMRFTAAELYGEKVRQVVQMPFRFSLSTEGGTIEASTPVSGSEPARTDVVPERSPREPTGETYFEFQVESPVTAKPGGNAVRYPAPLRAANIEGEVLAQFAVDADGVPDATTFKVLRSTDEQISAAVREALPSMRFNPAKVGGHAVRQLVQMPFTFALSR